MSSLTNAALFERLLIKMTEQRIEELKDNAIIGQLSIEDYRRVCGQVQGLKEALDLIEEAKAEASKH